MEERDDFHINKFKPSSTTVIEGVPNLIQTIVFTLSIESIIILDKDSLFIDSYNIFNPYDILKIIKTYNIISNIEQRKILSRMHIVRAFTEYQIDSLIKGLDNVIREWNPAILIVSYLPYLFYGSDKNKNTKNLFESSIKRLKSITTSTGIITVITSFGKSYYEDKFLASKADRVINIKKTKNVIIIIEDDKVVEHVPVPSGQTRFSDY